MEQNTVASFAPTANGFHFPNSFTGPYLVVRVPVYGTVDIGDASKGLCGAMAFTVRDFFEAHLPTPATTTPPLAGSPLFSYITGRLFDSFDIPDGIIEHMDWMSTPDSDVRVWLAVRRGIAWLTISISGQRSRPASTAGTRVR